MPLQTLNVSDSPLATADSTVPPLQASTLSALAAEDRKFDAHTSCIARFRALNFCTVLGFVVRIACNNEDEGHRTSEKNNNKGLRKSKRWHKAKSSSLSLSVEVDGAKSNNEASAVGVASKGAAATAAGNGRCALAREI